MNTIIKKTELKIYLEPIAGDCRQEVSDSIEESFQASMFPKIKKSKKK